MIGKLKDYEYVKNYCKIDPPGIPSEMKRFFGKVHQVFKETHGVWYCIFDEIEGISWAYSEDWFEWIKKDGEYSPSSDLNIDREIQNIIDSL